MWPHGVAGAHCWMTLTGSPTPTKRLHRSLTSPITSESHLRQCNEHSSDMASTDYHETETACR